MNIVAREDAEMLIMLLPISTALSILDDLPNIFSTIWAFLFPFSHSVLMRMWLTVVNAVSADEKNPDSSNKINKIISWIMSPESKYITPILSFFEDYNNLQLYI